MQKKNHKKYALCGAFLTAVSGCLSSTVPANAESCNGKVITGHASYYGKAFHNKLTANEERFDMHAMTAAHKTLPFNTRVAVSVVGESKTVIVRINDRGPFIKGRDIDLSRSAAEQLGFIDDGVAKVRMQLCVS